MKTRTKITIGIIGVAVIAIAWWLISPLFLTETVDEGLPPTAVESPAPEEEAGEETSETPKAQPQPEVAGVFMDGEKNYETTGTIRSVEAEDGTYLRFEEFETTNGPDLFVYLTKPGQETTEGVSLGALKGNIGNQNYLVPEDVNLEEYTTVVIWCRAFSATFGTGELTGTSE
ncbi:MAG: DM13 domain-containing protein [Exiguobacterium marinum]|uniref:DM13 domain-containing protein n=1 Tax=Exiguobacterium marinum TaxID=273528 RepID=A0ABY7WVU8_9BACL|nr:DM13 domain-containing protein [Exiguobacterium marinum]WDH74675.1 DM13 domain-containing protein [Exiguobacterium marinum]